jgi:hypothetical protein
VKLVNQLPNTFVYPKGVVARKNRMSDIESEYLNENSLLSKSQSGFRPKHGTVGALIQMCDQWLSDMAK